MPELFDDGPDEDAFALPGDEATLAKIATARDAAPAPEVTGEPAAAETASEPAAEPEPAAAVETEPVAAAETEPAEVDDQLVQEYLAKYDGDQAKALKAAANQESLIGRQGQELGELRRLVEQGFSTLDQERTAAAVEPEPQYDFDALEGWFSENPTKIPEIAAQAYYRGNEQLLDAAIVAWEEVDRAGAKRFERQIAAATASAQLRQETVQQTADMAGWNEVAAQFATDHPDLEQFAPRMRELAAQFPKIVSVLQTGDTEAKKEVLEFLYDKASRGQETDTRVRAREIAREQAQEAEQAIADATVASAATAVPPAATSVSDRIADEWDKVSAPYNDGWNV